MIRALAALVIPAVLALACAGLIATQFHKASVALEGATSGVASSEDAR